MEGRDCRGAATGGAGLVAVALLVAGCASPSPAGRAAALARAADAPHPRGVLASSPPADFSATPLRCWQDGPATICKRSD